MASGVSAAERLRQYLRELKPGARALLISELERAVLRGDEMPGAELVLQELRRSIRDESARSPRMSDAARLFLQPLEPFLVEDICDHPLSGRLACSALDPVWRWICRDLMPTDAD